MIKQEALKSLSETQLLAINKAVCDEIRQRRSTVARESVREFKFGDRARFYSDKFRKWITINVTRLNSKTVSGYEVSDEGVEMPHRQWRVAPSILMKVV